jgi:hypothetical protein
MSSNTANNNDEGAFKIQPHPAKTNDPNDLVENTPGQSSALALFPACGGADSHATLSYARPAGLGSAPTLQDLKKAEMNPMGGRGDQPYIPNEDLIKNLEAPKSHDELRLRQEALNAPSTPSGEGNAGEL